MSDVVRLVAATRRVSLISDISTADDLGRLHDFWSNRPLTADEDDLMAASDRDLRNEVMAEGLDADMPEALRRIVRGKPDIRAPALALAASLVLGVGLGLVYWNIDDTHTQVAGQSSEGIDPYVLLQPERPSASARTEDAASATAGLQFANSGHIIEAGSMTRPELHEMQRLLNRLGYGPVRQDGLVSEALDAAIARFRQDKGLVPETTYPRDVLVMLRQAARIEELRATDIQGGQRKGE